MHHRAAKKISGHVERPYRLENAPLEYAPQNELGVVYIFSSLARRFGLRIERIQPQFPDCIAYQRTGKGEKRVRIEFEYKARNFNHDPKKCDWLVCWENNWPSAPKSLRVIELRREFGLGLDVWIQPVSDESSETLARLNSYPEWSVPSLAKKGDLILFYRTKPDKFIRDVFKLSGDVEVTGGEWRENSRLHKDYEAAIRRVATLSSPVHYEDFKLHPVLRTSPFVRARMQGRPNVTEYWPYIYDMIIRRNRDTRNALKPYEPR